jgi:hypothetical protein
VTRQSPLSSCRPVPSSVWCVYGTTDTKLGDESEQPIFPEYQSVLPLARLVIAPALGGIHVRRIQIAFALR